MPLAFRADFTVNGDFELFRLGDLTTPGQSPVLLQGVAGGNIADLRWTP